MTVNNGTRINLATLPTRSLSINIVPNKPIGSLKIQHNGVTITENVAPYSLAGDINGAFNTANLSVGNHTITSTPYPLANLGGTPGPSTTISFTVIDQKSVKPPTLLTQGSSGDAIAFNAMTLVREPFALTTEQNLSSDKRTRVILFAVDFDQATGSLNSDIQIEAENPVLGTITLPIEHIGKTPSLEWLTQIRIVLPDELRNAGDVWIRVKLFGERSNQARLLIKQSAGATNLPPKFDVFWWPFAKPRRPLG